MEPTLNPGARRMRRRAAHVIVSDSVIEKQDPAARQCLENPQLTMMMMTDKNRKSSKRKEVNDQILDLAMNLQKLNSEVSGLRCASGRSEPLPKTHRKEKLFRKSGLSKNDEEDLELDSTLHFRATLRARLDKVDRSLPIHPDEFPDPPSYVQLSQQKPAVRFSKDKDVRNHGNNTVPTLRQMPSGDCLTSETVAEHSIPVVDQQLVDRQLQNDRRIRRAQRRLKRAELKVPEDIPPSVLQPAPTNAEQKPKNWLHLTVALLSAALFFWNAPHILSLMADPTGMMETGKFVHQLSKDFPSQPDPTMWLSLKHRLNTRATNSVPQILILTSSYSSPAGQETAACLISRLAKYVKDYHDDKRVHVLDVQTLDSIDDTQHLHVPLFFHFALERDHALVLLNAQKLKAASSTQMNPFLSQGGKSYKHPTFAFFLAKLNSTSDRPDEMMARNDLARQWVANGWDEGSVRELLSRVRSTVIPVVPETKIPCESVNFSRT